MVEGILTLVVGLWLATMVFTGIASIAIGIFVYKQMKKNGFFN